MSLDPFPAAFTLLLRGLIRHLESTGQLNVDALQADIRRTLGATDDATCKLLVELFLDSLRAPPPVKE